MAGDAFGVIEAYVSHHLFVGIVTGSAADAPVGTAPAAALRQAVGLEANVDGRVVFGRRHVHWGAVAGAAVIAQLHRIERPGVEDRRSSLVDPILAHGVDMFRSRSVAGLTRESGSSVGLVELPMG